MKKTIAFCRISTTNNQDTISQRTAIEDYCAKNSIVVDEWIEDCGVSGFKVDIDDRKSLNYIKSLALNDELERLIIFNSDRIIRQTSGSMYLKTLALNSVKIISVTEGELFKDENFGELLAFIRFFNSNQESKKISNRISAGKQAGFKVGNFQGGLVNYGYKLEDGKLQIDEIESNVVRKLYELYNSQGMKACLQWLDDNNIDKRGYTWTANSIWQLLTNPIYYGQRQSKKHEIPYDKSLQIVSKEDWQYTQELLKSRRTIGYTKHTIKSDALLESLFHHKVGDEVHKLYIDYQYSKRKILVYRCHKCKINRNRSKGTKYNFTGTKYHKIIEKEIKNILSNLSVEALESQYCKTKALELTIIENEIKDISSKLQLKKKALQGASFTLEQIFAGTLDLDIHIVSNKIKSIQGDIIELEAELNKLNTNLHNKELEQLNKNRLLNKYKDFSYLWDIADTNQKKSIIQELVDKITIDSDDNIEIKLNI